MKFCSICQHGISGVVASVGCRDDFHLRCLEGWINTQVYVSDDYDGDYVLENTSRCPNCLEHFDKVCVAIEENDELSLAEVGAVGGIGDKDNESKRFEEGTEKDGEGKDAAEGTDKFGGDEAAGGPRGETEENETKLIAAEEIDAGDFGVIGDNEGAVGGTGENIGAVAGIGGNDGASGGFSDEERAVGGSGENQPSNACRCRSSTFSATCPVYVTRSV